MPSSPARGGGRSPDVGEPGPVDWFAPVVREHEPVGADREAGEVAGKCVQHHRRERDGPAARLRLGWRQNRAAAGQQDELAVDPELPAEEVDSILGDAERLALPEPGTPLRAPRGPGSEPGWPRRGP